MSSDTESAAQMFLDDLNCAIARTRAINRACDLVVTIRIQPGDVPSYEARIIKKRRPRRRKEADARQVELFPVV